MMPAVATTHAHKQVMKTLRIATLLILLTCFAEARAATYTVTTPEDEFDTPSGASVSLAEALRDAAAKA